MHGAHCSAPFSFVGHILSRRRWSFFVLGRLRHPPRSVREEHRRQRSEAVWRADPYGADTVRPAGCAVGARPSSGRRERGGMEGQQLTATVRHRPSRSRAIDHILVLPRAAWLVMPLHVCDFTDSYILPYSLDHTSTGKTSRANMFECLSQCCLPSVKSYKGSGTMAYTMACISEYSSPRVSSHSIAHSLLCSMLPSSAMW